MLQAARSHVHFGSRVAHNSRHTTEQKSFVWARATVGECCPLRLCACVQAREAREKEEMATALSKLLASVEEGHAAHVAAHRKALAEAEENQAAQVGERKCSWIVSA